MKASTHFAIAVILKEASLQRLDVLALFFSQAHNIFLTNVLLDDCAEHESLSI